MAVYASVVDVAVPAQCLLILLRPENLYVILARHNELPEDEILNAETCGSVLFVIIVFDIIVQPFVRIVNKFKKWKLFLNSIT